MPNFLARKNQDGSYTLSVPAGELDAYAFVDYYNETTGAGFQRRETLTPKRARDIADYIKRCVTNGVPWRLFEMTANARVAPSDVSFDPLDDDASLGFLEIASGAGSWLSMIDGGTRLVGIRCALADSIISKEHRFDVRVFVGLSLPEEIALFLLINETQKKVRTDLGLRVVQRALDEGKLKDHELGMLKTVVPDTESWKYDASRISARLNSDPDSPWLDLIQMPGDLVTRPIKLQAIFTSLRPVLTDPDLRSRLVALEKQGSLAVGSQSVSPDNYLLKVLKNFWTAVAEACPQAHREPQTNVLWGSIGAASCHDALTKVIATVLANEAQPDLTKGRFSKMITDSDVVDYAFWFSRSGSLSKDSYPGEKGEATRMTGAANYSRLARQLEQQWRAALHAAEKQQVAIA